MIRSWRVQRGRLRSFLHGERGWRTFRWWVLRLRRLRWIRPIFWRIHQRPRLWILSSQLLFGWGCLIACPCFWFLLQLGRFQPLRWRFHLRRRRWWRWRRQFFSCIHRFRRCIQLPIHCGLCQIPIIRELSPIWFQLTFLQYHLRGSCWRAIRRWCPKSSCRIFLQRAISTGWRRWR
jgi:hypothetical protein